MKQKIKSIIYGIMFFAYLTILPVVCESLTLAESILVIVPATGILYYGAVLVNKKRRV